MKYLAGGLLVLAAAVLIAAQYLSAAIFMSGVSAWSGPMFWAGMEYVGWFLPATAFCLLCAGLVLIVRAGLEGRDRKK